MQHPALRLPLPLRPCGPGRGAFTLVEMLVVVSIMSIIAALAFGSLFGTVSHNRLLATEHLIADSVRQARHTARSTGQPAVLTITPVTDDSVPPKVVGGRIAGTSRICVWSETFEELVLPDLGLAGDGTPLPAIQDPGNTDGGALVVGRTGKGVVVNAFPAPYSTLCERLVTQTLEKPAQIVRGARTDGFYLTCSVRPPSARVAAEGFIIPLVMISDSPNATDSQCGLRLVRTRHPLSGTLELFAWDVDGWVSGAVGSPAHATSFDAATRVASVDPDPPTDLPDPISGGEWVEIGMLYTNNGGGGAAGTHGRLALFVDGRRIAEKSVATIIAPVDIPQTLIAGATVYIGHATFDLTNPDLRGVAPLDDVCLYRVGTDQVGNLPGSVIPTGTLSQGAQIVALPDGRIQVQPVGAVTAGTSTPLTFEELHAPQQTRVEITIDARGVVTSRYLAPGAPP
ncbi:MAG: prepilin-type N-terminal cleavage/methylation domain-containing protein [Planctomycetes bacterium]|nr:prepilin-type N-terminal cleavage/methylation domain-containing protein [Planctomycetota bacterium]